MARMLSAYVRVSEANSSPPERLTLAVKKKRSKALKVSRPVFLDRSQDPDRVIILLESKGYKAKYAPAIITNAPKSQLKGHI